MKRVLLLSAGSPCRAVMAEAILKKYIDKKENIDFVGVGIEPKNIINKNIMKILAEEGIDTSKLIPKILKDVEDIDFDLILIICSHSKEICPQFPRVVPTIHMEFPIINNENEVTCRALAQRIKSKVKPIILKSIQ
jgi:arsenate reductase